MEQGDGVARLEAPDVTPGPGNRPLPDRGAIARSFHAARAVEDEDGRAAGIAIGMARISRHDLRVSRPRRVLGPEGSRDCQRRGTDHRHPRQEEDPFGDLGPAPGRHSRLAIEEHRGPPVDDLAPAAIPEVDQERDRQAEQAPEERGIAEAQAHGSAPR